MTERIHYLSDGYISDQPDGTQMGPAPESHSDGNPERGPE